MIGPVDEVPPAASRFDGGARRALLITKTDFGEPRDGGALRVRAIHRELVRDGWHVDWCAVRGQARVSQGMPSPRELAGILRVVSRFVRVASVTTAAWFRPGMVRDLMALRSAGEYDLAVVEYSQLLGYAPVLPRPLMVDLHNVESELMRNYATSASSIARRLTARYESWRLRRQERALQQQVDGIIAVSPHDADVLAGLGGPDRSSGAVDVAPNGVDDAAFLFDGPRRDTVVFVAHLGWRPNVDAAIWLVREVWPRVRRLAPELRLQLVGRSPAPAVTALAGPDVEVHADVPSVLPFVGSARIATAPLLAAGGTRLKILEALACGTAVVATPLGALGLEHLAGPLLRIAGSPDDFAQAVVSAARSEYGRSEVRELVEPYRWTVALRPLVSRAGSLVGIS